MPIKNTINKTTDYTKHNKSSNLTGFTLLEIIVVMSIFILIFIIGSEFIIKGFKSISFGSEQATAINHARKAMENLSVDLREAKKSEKGDYPLLVIEPQNFVWYGDIDNNGVTEKIRYFLDNTELKKTIIEPGLDNNYDGIGTTQAISKYVNNQSENIFTYYDSDNNETNLINGIRLINIKLKINVTPEIAPGDYYIESDIQLRNLKDNL